MKSAYLDTWLHDDYDEDINEEMFLDLFESDDEFRSEAIEQQQMHLALKGLLNKDSNRPVIESTMDQIRSESFEFKKAAQTNIKTGKHRRRPTRSKRKRKKKSNTLFFAFAAAAALALSLVIINQYSKGKNNQVASQVLKDGERKKLTLESGVNLNVTGPAEFKVKDNSLELYKGLVSAEVPSGAEGFTVNTPHGKVIDLGTEFSTKASAKATLTKVNKGKVSINNGSLSQKLTRGQSAALENGEFRELQQNELLFDLPLTGKSISINFGGEKDVKGIVDGIWNSYSVGNLDTLVDASNNKTTLEVTSNATGSSGSPNNNMTGTQRLFSSKLMNSKEQTLQINLKNIPYKNYSIILYYYVLPDKDDDYKLSVDINDRDNFIISRPPKEPVIKIPDEFQEWQTPLIGNFLKSVNLQNSEVSIKVYKTGEAAHSFSVCAIQILELFEE